MHLVIGGNVQGVGFRATTQFIATELGIKGSVKNLVNGNVEIFAQGEEKQLETLLSRLKMHFHNFNMITLEFRQPVYTFDSFTILRT